MHVNGTPTYNIGDTLHAEWHESSADGVVEGYVLDDQERLCYFVKWTDGESGPYPLRELEGLKAKVIEKD